MSSSPTDTEHSTAHPVPNPRAAYDAYLVDSTTAYRTYVASVAAARSVAPEETEETAATTTQGAAPGKYRAGLAAVRQAGLPAAWAAGLIAMRAAVAYGKYVAGLSAIQASGLPEATPPAEGSDAQRAASDGVSDADQVAATPPAEPPSTFPAG